MEVTGDAATVRDLFHDLANSLSQIALLGTCLEDFVSGEGEPLLTSLAAAAEEASEKVRALRGALGLDDATASGRATDRPA